MFQKIARMLGGDPNKKEIEKYAAVVEKINALEPRFEAMSEDELRRQTALFRQRLAGGETLDDLLVEAFAAVREASKRTLGLRHYDVQMIGGMVLHHGKIAEMRTGEGKTLVATLPVYLNALTGRGVHIITVNDYLARRDARWMAPIYSLLGMSVGVLQMAARTENGKKAFLVDLEKTSAVEDQHQLVLVDRVEAYNADITYGTNSEFGFDYLRDNLTNSLKERVQRGHYYAIIDEVDNVLIDEARTPLIISGPASEDTEWYVRMAQVVRALNPEDYEINEKDRNVTLTEVGEAHVEELLQTPLRDPDRPEDISPEQARLLGFLEQALRAQHLYRRNKDYIVQGGKVVIVDEFTGRLMPGRRWSEGLHQAVEAKEGVRVEPETITYATITIQNYFRMYEKLAGMTGTALTEAEEFSKIYKLDVLPIPTNLEYNAIGPNASLVEVTDKDADGYRYTYYARLNDPSRKPVFFKRKDYPDVVYRTEEAKLRAITLEILRYHIFGRPQLIGTTSVEHSERLSDRLGSEPLRRLAQTLLLREAWLKKHNRQQAETAIPELAFLNKPLDSLNTAEMRQFGRANGLSTISVEDPENLDTLISLLGLRPEDRDRLLKVLQGGIPHQVLNARKHDEESQIIARAGAYGAVTIATNMAGRGVDIKLGGELDEEIYRDVTRVLDKAGIDPYGMNMQQIRQALQNLSPDQYGVYEESVRAFLKQMDEADKVRELGGLHVIGSERHEARRIDNQLRGRSARQGDPGSSRFYLSLEDELMRLFGGGQVEALMKRLNIDESLPIESNLVGRLVEQSQTRVEGANFDVRKHLLEYDDVLNAQRKRIYSQRDMVFTKEDLTEDVEAMLEADISNRIPAAFDEDEEGPWKLLGYLEEIQPPVLVGNDIYPTFALNLVLGALKKHLPAAGASPADLKQAYLEVAGQALEAEKEHLLRATQEMLDRLEETLERQRQERFDAIDTFQEGRGLGADEEDEEGGLVEKPQDVVNELSNLVRTPLRLSGGQIRQLMDGDPEVFDQIREQVDSQLTSATLDRLVGALKRRLDGFNLAPADLQGKDWLELSDDVLDEVEAVFERRKSALLGPNGQVASDLDQALSRLPEGVMPADSDLLRLLLAIGQGTRVSFDAATHRKTFQMYLRLNYIYYAARLLGGRQAAELRSEVLEHLRGAKEANRRALGLADWNRLSAADVTLSQLDERVRTRLANRFGSERMEELLEQPLRSFSPEDRDIVVEILGWRLQNEFYRQLLLNVISQLWVEYLTRMDALRVSIGLEAYAQRDPLVQYKGRASELFTQLLADIRAGVVTRMFKVQPTRQAMPAPEQREAVPSKADKPAVKEAVAAAQDGKAESGTAAGKQGKKRKRKRR